MRRNYLPRDYHSPKGRILRFIANLLLPYSWARHVGFLDGAKKQRYFEGFADGQDNTHKFYADHIHRYYKLKALKEKL